MGCWNETCGVSQLPIQQGDKIRVFVLAKSRSHRHGGGGFCENDDAWAPYGFCVQGKYNDYGSIEKVKNNYVTKLLFNKIKDNIDFDNYDEERHYHVNLKSKKLNWTDIVTAISQEEMTLSDTLPGIMFVLEDIYQTLISATRIDTCRDKGGYLYKKLDEVIKDDSVVFFEKMKGIASKRLSIKNKSNDSSTVEKLKLQIQIDHLSDILDNDYNSIVGNQFSGHRHFYLKHYKEEIISLAEKGKEFEDENVQEIFKALKEHICFNFSLMSLRKGWQPQFGKGSQDFEHGTHLILAKSISDICNKREELDNSDGGNAGSEFELSEWQIEHNEKEIKRRKLLVFA